LDEGGDAGVEVIDEELQTCDLSEVEQLPVAFVFVQNIRSDQFAETLSSLCAKEIGEVVFDEVALEDRMDVVLDGGAASDEVCAA